MFIFDKKGHMSIEKDEATIQALLMNCGIKKSDVDEVSGEEKLKQVIIKNKPSRVLKYIKFEPEYTKEHKYGMVLKDVLKVIDAEFLLTATQEGWLEVTYTRQYVSNGKVSNGSPVFNIFAEDGSKKRFAEVNSRFPILNLLTELRIKYNKKNIKVTQGS